MGDACKPKVAIVLDSPMCSRCNSRASLKSKGGLCYACIRWRDRRPLFCDAGRDDHRNRSGLWDYGSPSDDEDLSDCYQDDVWCEEDTDD